MVFMKQVWLYHETENHSEVYTQVLGYILVTMSN